MTLSVILESKNPRDLSLADVEDLRKELEHALSSARVELVGKPHKAGTYAVTPYEVLTVWIPTGVTYATVVAAFAKWARQRFTKNSRPKSLSVYDEKGNAVGSFVISSLNGDLEENLASKTADKQLPPRDQINASGNPDS